MNIHIVQKGDTLWKIAKMHNVPFEEIKKANAHLANPDYIVPGMKVFVPVTGGKPTTSTLPTVDIPKKMEKTKAETLPTVPILDSDIHDTQLSIHMESWKLEASTTWQEKQPTTPAPAPIPMKPPVAKAVQQPEMPKAPIAPKPTAPMQKPLCGCQMNPPRPCTCRMMQQNMSQQVQPPMQPTYTSPEMNTNAAPYPGEYPMLPPGMQAPPPMYCCACHCQLVPIHPAYYPGQHPYFM
ncbi:LysM peptidoglycan-binding domain-containing protein [Paenisporosarcina cavernae]|uniref:LysM peptidoglycan-binding domain-containing protein n=1 Tax=Paenisporosarcina cavernae TaxID=2320858 RepID=A0A385YT60_9BACL|nr:LysM domain-containing protein [Paenisporosarcina cavernae]AYC29734.1 LysM peptidoglycan-binding domain-containing protein [Paenisporosarcina cavernae]